MGLESATYIGSLNSSNPTASDSVAQGDDHIRLLKSTILASFPSITGAMSLSHTQLNLLDSKSLTTDGYQKFPSGLILQWGTFTYSGDSGSESFPIAFPTACLGVIANMKTDNGSVTVTSWTTTQLNASSLIGAANATGSNDYNYFAVGY